MRVSIAAASMLALLGCRSAPLGAIPEPLPEATPWVASQQTGAYLGLKTEENAGDSLDELSFDPGVRVVSVVENSPAHHVGLRTGDVVLTADDRELVSPSDLDALVAETPAGTEVRLRVQREDTVFAVPVELASATATGARRPETLYRLDPARSMAGWATAPGGVVLVSAAEESPILDAGLVLGDKVVTVDGERVHSDRGLIRVLGSYEPGKRVPLEYEDDEGVLHLTSVRLYEPPTYVTDVGLAFLAQYEAQPEDDKVSLSILDLWFFELLQYERDGVERRWVLFELFGFELISFGSAIGELSG